MGSRRELQSKTPKPRTTGFRSLDFRFSVPLWFIVLVLTSCFLITGCKWDLGQTLFHPSVDERVQGSL